MYQQDNALASKSCLGLQIRLTLIQYSIYIVASGKLNSRYHTTSSPCTGIGRPVGEFFGYQNLVQSMPRLVLAVLKTKGGPTCYVQDNHNVMALECISVAATLSCGVTIITIIRENRKNGEQTEEMERL